MYPLSRLSHEFGKHVIDKDSRLEVFDAPSSHALIQAAGYLKYTLAKDAGQGVFFRGQTQLYNTLSPTIFRNIKSDRTIIRRRRMLLDFLAKIETEKQVLRAVTPECREALLQHYGIKSTWIDVVDNIWIALWFACYHARTSGWPEEYLHFEKRIPNHKSDEFAYVLLLASAYIKSNNGQLGYYKDKRSETIDLRVAVPSHFVRPHAQHAILVRRLSKTGLPVGDNLPLHVGTIRVRLSAALDWLGTGTSLTSHSLFPPAYYDYGYRELLEGIKPPDRVLGSIYRIQA
ncbi:MAG: FRG domain-containing protein [Anaerolineaceae bacterium]|nr:FRG domain-containing protein [Anaerolineaceae bacterium]